MSTLIGLIFILQAWKITADVGCLYGWKLSDYSETCLLNCNDTHGSRWNVACESAPLQCDEINYNVGANSLYMAVGESLTASNFRLPSCYNNTFHHLTSVNIPCYPLSPQLLQCQLRQTQLNEYYIENGTTLVIPTANITARLGDFYIDRNNSAFICQQTIQNRQIARCNYVILHPDQYYINEDRSMYLYRANFTIKNPIYSVVLGGRTIVCIPLNINFINCHKHSKTMNYMFLRDYSIIIFEDLMIYKPDAYIINYDGSVAYCWTDTESKVFYVSILQYFYVAVCILSVIVLSITIVTVILKFKQLNNVFHMLCVAQHLFCLLMVYIMLLVIVFHLLKSTQMQCYVLFFVVNYFNIGIISSLNMVVLDLWQTFAQSSLSTRLNNHSNSINKSCLVKYLLYNVYGSGVPFVLTVVVLAINFDKNLCGFTFGLCPHLEYTGWFISVDTYSIYTVLPFSIMTIINLVLLGITIRAIHRSSSETDIVNPDWRQQMLHVCVKLFVLTGFCYVIFFTCFIIDTIDTSYYMYTAIVYDGTIISQGIAIFLIYYKKYLLELIWKKTT